MRPNRMYITLFAKREKKVVLTIKSNLDKKTLGSMTDYVHGY